MPENMHLILIRGSFLSSRINILHVLLFSKGYLFNFATTATKKISESVAETAQTIKKSVEEGKIETIIDKVPFLL